MGAHSARRPARWRSPSARLVRRTVAVTLLAASAALILPGLGAGGRAGGAPSLDPDYVAEAQEHLNRLGLPAGPADGIDGPMTGQALCGLRWLRGFRVVDRHPLAEGDVEMLRQVQALRSPGGVSTLWVSISCQLAAEVGPSGELVQVIRVATGRPRFETPTGSFGVWSYEQGWFDSTLYPSGADGGNMLNPACFSGTYCVHGSRLVGDGATWPGSAGCVRVREADVAVTGRIARVNVVV
jgi:L,D-transpeptidase catalytic domain